MQKALIEKSGHKPIMSYNQTDFFDNNILASNMVVLCQKSMVNQLYNSPKDRQSGSFAFRYSMPLSPLIRLHDRTEVGACRYGRFPGFVWL